MVILDQIALELFHRQRSFSQTGHKLVFRKGFPYWLDVGTIQYVLDKSAAAYLFVQHQLVLCLNPDTNEEKVKYC